MKNKMFAPIPIEQEPKKVNRFLLEFPKDIAIETFVIQKAARPCMTLKNGKYVWHNLNIEMLDCIGPSTSRPVMEWIKEHKTENIFERILMFLKIKKAKYKKDLVLKSLDPTGVEIEQWNLIGCEIKKADFGVLDYAKDDIMTVKLELKIDYAVLV
jgi:hypothetical protein